MPKVIAVVNQKGGVGKTTTAVNLAAGLALAERPTLLIDLDPQGNATTGLGVNKASLYPTVYHVLLGGESTEKAIHPTSLPGLRLLPADIDLVGAEIELVGLGKREHRLRLALEPVLASFDYVIVDCPPSLGLLTINALVAADRVLVPLQCEFYALEGLAQLMRSIERVQLGLNPRLTLHGVLLTMYDRRNNLCDLVAADVRGHFGDKVYDTVIPRNVRVSEAPSHGLPVLIYDHRCPGSQAYTRLAAEMLRRSAAA